MHQEKFYRGWVPTVNGRLSFKIIGECTHPQHAKYSNVETEKHQYVLARQFRQASDVLFYRVASKLLRLSGNFDFFLCARARRSDYSSDASLVGRIYFVRAKSAGRKAIDEVFPSWMTTIRNAEYSTQDLRSPYAEIHNHLEVNSDLFANVILSRDGFICIWRLKWKDPTLYENSHSAAFLDGDRIDHGMADQFYYFVRDISHHHQHHGPDADTIITTHATSGDSLLWCNRIIYSLYYYIIVSKRKLSPADQVSILGVLAYLKSFKTICSERAARSKRKIDLPPFNDESARESIIAKKEYLDTKFAERRQITDRYRFFLLTLAAIILSLISFVTGFADKDIAPLWWVTEMANFTKKHAYVCLIPLLLIFVWYMSDVLLGRPLLGQSKGWLANIWRDTVRLALFNKGAAQIILFITGMILLYYSVFWTINIILDIFS
ncbi:hypothetical protein [Roseibium sp. LAB1]